MGTSGVIRPAQYQINIVPTPWRELRPAEAYEASIRLETGESHYGTGPTPSAALFLAAHHWVRVDSAEIKPWLDMLKSS